MNKMKKKILILLQLILISSFTYSEGYNGEIIAPRVKVSVDYQNANLVDVLRNLSFDNDLNMVINNDVQGSVTLSVRNALVDDLLEAILRMNGYTYLKNGDLVEVISLEEVESILTIDKPISKTFRLKNVAVIEVLEDLAKLLGEGDTIIEDEDTNSVTVRTKRREMLAVESYLRSKDGQKVSQTRKNVELIRMNHLAPQDVFDILVEMDYKIPGDIKVSETLNGLIVTADEGEVSLLKSVLEKIDSPEHQVVIEARIVEVTEGDGKDWGISWQYNANQDADNREDDSDTAIPGSNRYFDVSDLSSGINLGLGLLGSDQFTAIYRNIITNSTSEILARPTITTLNGKQAKIDIIDEVPFKQLEFISDSGDGSSSSFEFKEVGVTLEVTPQVSEDGLIKMEVAPSISEVTATTSDGIPVVSTRSVVTNVMVRNGETLAIGGLIRDNTTLSETEDPFFSKLPVLGYMFKSTDLDKDKTNLMIFITPRLILNRDLEERVRIINGGGSTGVRSLKKIDKPEITIQPVTNQLEDDISDDNVTTGINRIQEKLQNVINSSN